MQSSGTPLLHDAFMITRIRDHIYQSWHVRACLRRYTPGLPFNNSCFACRARFNILFHGLGSKRNAINDFAEQALTDGGLVVINAFHSPVSAKQIILAAISALSGQPESDFRCVHLRSATHLTHFARPAAPSAARPATPAPRLSFLCYLR